MSTREWREPLRIEINYNELIWQILQEINTSFQSPTFYMEETHGKYGGRTESKSLTPIERFEDNVLTLRNYILPDWIEQDEQQLVSAKGGRLALWVPKYLQWKKDHMEWKFEYDRWRGTHDQDPLTEPIEPTMPPKPTSYAQDVKEAYDDKLKMWQPWKLHQAVINLLHRRDFFKHTNPIEAIDAQSEEPALEESQNTGGSASGTGTEPTIEKPSIIS